MIAMRTLPDPDTTAQSLKEHLATWTFFQKHRWVSPGKAHTAIINSWERCVRQSNPYKWSRPHIASGATLASLHNRSKDLVTLSQSVLEDSWQLLDPASCALLLTDVTGCTLVQVGNNSFIDTLNELGLRYGAFWNEGRLGTNAISLALHTNEPVSVIGAQHYNQQLHFLACYAAPVFDINGRVRACLGLACPAESHQPAWLALIQAAARDIGNRLELERSLTETNMLITQRDAVLENIDDGLLAWDPHHRISFINPKAAECFKRPKDRIIGCQLADLVTLPPLIRTAIKEQRHLSHVDITFECEDEFIEARVTLQPLVDGSFLFFLHLHVDSSHQAYYPSGSHIELTFDALVAASNSMQQVVTQAKRATRSRLPVMLRGEAGVGKHQLAQMIHHASHPQDAPFVVVNCQLINTPDNMIELLGSDEGEGQPSKFEMANGGTLYLEQVESLCRPAQAALLQLLKTSLCCRTHSQRLIPVNFRLITSTRGDLQQYIQSGAFSRQLYLEIGSIEIAITPLRNRPEDLASLIDNGLQRLSARYESPLSLSEPARDVLLKYNWPGNITELKHQLEHAAINRRSDRIELVDLPEQVFTSITATTRPLVLQSLEAAERQAILNAWEACDGSINQMTEALQVARTTLWRKLKKYGLGNR